jgi:hypothetical protein
VFKHASAGLALILVVFLVVSCGPSPTQGPTTTSTKTTASTTATTGGKAVQPQAAAKQHVTIHVAEMKEKLGLT